MDTDPLRFPAANLPAGGLSKEYKTKFRSLVFNLKDANNPDLRARVLQVRWPGQMRVSM